MAFGTTEVAGSGESTLDRRIGAISLVVTNLATVVALAGKTLAFGLLGALASEVTFLVAAGNRQCQLKS
jgi:hypothetical protein